MARHGKSKAWAKKGPKKAPKKAPLMSPHRFTMQEEARNTEGHSRDWRTSSNLRHKAVQFVKAGHVQRSEFETIETAEEDGELQVDDQPATAAFQSDPESRAEPQEATEPRDLSAVMLPRMDDVKHPTSLHLDQAPSDFHESSDSSEDEVVFTGRKPSMRPVVIETSQAELDLMFQNHAQETEVVKSTPAPTMDSLTTGKPQSDSSHARVQKNKRDTRGWTRKDEDDMLADYIVNMDSDYLEALGVQQGEHRRKNEDKQSAEESSSDEDGAASIISAEFRALLKGDSKEDSGRNSIDSGLSRMRIDAENEFVLDSDDSDDDDEEDGDDDEDDEDDDLEINLDLMD